MSLFANHTTFLALCLSDHPDTPFEITTSGCQIRTRGAGIVEILPLQAEANSPALMLSAGIHGNETGPIELLDRLLSAIADGRQKVCIPVLIVFGHLPAMRVQKRFLTTNLNRLFTTSILTSSQVAETEPARAQEIMQISVDFANRYPDFTHYDLHTAIRDSAIEKFALYPFVAGRALPASQKQLLSNAGVEAILIQNKPSSTYSAFTSSVLKGESFTVELGKVKPFGKNDPRRLSKLENVLTTLISADTPMTNLAKPATHNENCKVQIFYVCHEIINTGDTFTLNIPEDIANFSAFDDGYEVWRDDRQSYRVEGSPQYIVFPNSKVEPGQRAGLLIKPA